MKEPADLELEPGVHVAAVYEAQWYVGRVLSVDTIDEVEITFLERKKSLFQWPSRPDVVWVPRKDVPGIVSELQPCAKTGRMLKLFQPDHHAVSIAFDMYVTQ